MIKILFYYLAIFSLSLFLLSSGVAKIVSPYRSDFLLPFPIHIGIAFVEILLVFFLLLGRIRIVAYSSTAIFIIGGVSAVLFKYINCGCFGSIITLTWRTHLYLASFGGLMSLSLVILSEIVNPNIKVGPLLKLSRNFNPAVTFRRATFLFLCMSIIVILIVISLWVPNSRPMPPENMQSRFSVEAIKVEPDTELLNDSSAVVKGVSAASRKKIDYCIGSINIKILDENDHPLPHTNILIWAGPPFGSADYHYKNPDLSSVPLLKGLSDDFGNYRLNIPDCPSLFVYAIKNKVGESSVNLIDIKQLTQLNELVLRVRLFSCVVGKVMDYNGAEIPGISIRADPIVRTCPNTIGFGDFVDNNVGRKIEISDTNGDFVFYLPGKIQYKFYAVSETGRFLSAGHLLAIAESGRKYFVSILLNGEYCINGTLKDSMGIPVPGIKVIGIQDQEHKNNNYDRVSQSTRMWDSDVTNSLGIFKLLYSDSGKFKVFPSPESLSRNNLPIADNSFVILDPQLKQRYVDLCLQPCGKISGSIKGGTQYHLKNCIICAIQSNDPTCKYLARPGEFGDFILCGLTLDKTFDLYLSFSWETEKVNRILLRGVPVGPLSNPIVLTDDILCQASLQCNLNVPFWNKMGTLYSEKVGAYARLYRYVNGPVSQWQFCGELETDGANYFYSPLSPGELYQILFYGQGLGFFCSDKWRQPKGPMRIGIRLDIPYCRTVVKLYSRRQSNLQSFGARILIKNMLFLIGSMRRFNQDGITCFYLPAGDCSLSIISFKENREISVFPVQVPAEKEYFYTVFVD